MTMPQWSNRWVMLAYRNGVDPKPYNAVLVNTLYTNYVDFRSYGVTISLNKIESDRGPSVTSSWKPKLIPSTWFDGWQRQMFIQCTWNQTVDFGGLQPVGNVLRLVVRSTISAVAAPGGTLLDPEPGEDSSLTHSISYLVNGKWQGGSALYEGYNLEEITPSLGTSTYSSIVWVTPLSSKIPKKATAFALQSSIVDQANFFGVQPSTTGPSQWTGNGAFTLETTQELAWWYIDSTPRELAFLETSSRIESIVTRRAELQKLVKSTVLQYDAKLPPSSGL